MSKKTFADITENAPAGGGFGLRSAYLGGRIHKGSRFWLQTIQPQQQEWAEYLGYPSFESLSIAHRRMVQSLIGDWLLVANYEPTTENSNSLKEIRAAMNSVTRLIKTLEGMKTESNVQDLREWMKEKNAAHN